MLYPNNYNGIAITDDLIPSSLYRGSLGAGLKGSVIDDIVQFNTHIYPKGPTANSKDIFSTGITYADTIGYSNPSLFLSQDAPIVLLRFLENLALSSLPPTT